MASHQTIEQTASVEQAADAVAGERSHNHPPGIGHIRNPPSATIKLGPAALDPRMFDDRSTDTMAALLQKWLRHPDPNQRLCPYHVQVTKIMGVQAAAIQPLDRYTDNINPSDQPGIYRGLNGKPLSTSKSCTCRQIHIDISAQGVKRPDQAASMHHDVSRVRS